MKQALILAGGASHGAYHVGVIRALLEGKVKAGHLQGPLNPDIIAGISAGAFNGAVLLSQLEANRKSAADYLEDVWLKRLAESKKRQGNGVLRFRGDPSEFFNPVGLARSGPSKPMRWIMDDTASMMREGIRRGLGFQRSKRPLVSRVTEQVNLSSFVSMKPFAKSIRKSVNFKSLQNSQRAFIAGTVGWDDGVLRYFTNRKPDRPVTTPTDPNPDSEPVYEHGRFGDIGAKIIRASAAVPGIFPLVKLDDELFCDGAAEVNTPLSCAIKFDADILHVVTSVPPVSMIPTPRLPNTFDTLYRFIVMREADAIRDDLDFARKTNKELQILSNLMKYGLIKDIPADELGMMAVLSDAEQKQRESASKEDLDLSEFIPFYENLVRPKKKRIEVHLYRPWQSLGGLLSLLRFDRKYLSSMINHGYQDALHHDCEKNGCVLID